MRHIQDIIVEDRKETASYVDFPLPKLTAPAVYFLRSRLLAKRVAKRALPMAFCKSASLKKCFNCASEFY